MKDGRKINSYLRLLLYILVLSVIFFILALCFLAGTGVIRSALGTSLAWLSDYTGALLWCFAVLELAVTLTGYFRVERLIRTETELLDQDQDTDPVNYQIEAWTIYTNILGYLIFIVSTVLYAFSLTGPGESEAFSIVPFILLSVFLAVYSIAYVKQAQRRDPSKKGDPVQFRFHRDWMESCDEAEREMTYQASYRSMRVLGWAIPICFLLAIWGHIMFGTGLMAIFLMGVLWCTVSLSYLFAKLKLLKTKLNQ